MTIYATAERLLTEALGLTHRPVAISFCDTPPAGVVRLAGAQPSSCSFWRLAANGQSFYTLGSDHYNCPVGSYTHNIPLPPEREPELMQTLSLMAGIGYIRMEEVPGVPRLPRTPAVIAYAPLGDAVVDPDVVLVAGRPARLMLLHEAANRAEKTALPLLGRPTCMAIPAALAGGVASSLGCVGNRIYTGIADDEFYTVMAGKDFAAIADQLSGIQQANATLAEYHAARKRSIAAIVN
jgi:uncharacterized protein (DUF169 family)